MIPKEYRGKVFLQIAPRLRWRGADGGVDSFRPIDELTGQVVGDPPTITFHDKDEADVDRWLGQGRIKLAPDQSVKAAPPMSDAGAHAKKSSDTSESGGA